MLSAVGVSQLTVLSVGLQPDGELQVAVSALQEQTFSQASWQVAAESLSRDLGVPVQIGANVMLADPSYNVKYEPNSIRLTERQVRELRRFIGTAKGPDSSYVSTYSGTEDADLVKRRITALGRYFRAATLSSEPDPKLPPDLIMVHEKTDFEVHGGQKDFGPTVGREAKH